jgi:hypothetical protein
MEGVVWDRLACVKLSKQVERHARRQGSKCHAVGSIKTEEDLSVRILLSAHVDPPWVLKVMVHEVPMLLLVSTSQSLQVHDVLVQNLQTGVYANRITVQKCMPSGTEMLVAVKLFQ